MQKLTKFQVHTTDVQCVPPWSHGTRPSGNPVRPIPSAAFACQFITAAVMRSFSSCSVVGSGEHKRCPSQTPTGRSHMV
jgi:hypothetical protein